MALVQLFGDWGEVVDPDVIRAEFEAARDAWKAATAGGVAYTQDALDAVRVLRNTAELAAWRWAWTLASVRGHGYPTAPQPTPVATPGVYPGIFPFSDPTTLGGMKLYLTADAGLTLDGSDNVVTWSDLSGAGNDAVADTQPFTKVPNIFGSLPGLFSSTGGNLKSATATRLFTPGAARTVLVVAKVHSVDGGCVFIDMQPGRSGHQTSLALGLWNFIQAGTVYPATDGVTVSESIATAPSAFADVAKLYAYRWRGFGNNVEFSVDGAPFAALTGSPITSEGGDDGYTIGHFFGTTEQGHLKGSLGAILAYAGEMADDAFGRLSDFLKTKFSLA